MLSKPINLAYTSPIAKICERVELIEEQGDYYKVIIPGPKNQKGVLIRKEYCKPIN